MKKRQLPKRLMALLLCGALLVPGSALAAEDMSVASSDFTLKINDRIVDTSAEDGQPYITASGRAMLPLRLVAEMLQCGVAYNGETGKVVVQSSVNGYEATFMVGEDSFTLGDEVIQLDAPVTVLDPGRAYVPARALAETFGSITWDNDTRTVAIDSENWTFINEPSLVSAIFGETPLANGSLPIILTDNSTGNSRTLAVPDELANLIVPDMEVRSIESAKLIDGHAAVAITAGHSPTMSTRYVVRDDGSDQMEYIGIISSDGDYTMDDQYLYYVEGMVNGPFPVNDYALHVDPLGNDEPGITLQVDFKISTCRLSMEDGLLIATEPLTEIRHEVDVQALLAEQE